MPNFLKNLKQLFLMPQTSPTDNFLKINVKCKRCGEEIKVNIRKTSDISRVYEEDVAPQGASFFLRKEVLGNKCNNLIFIDIYFDENLNVISKNIEGGEFL
jgi:hypothetical protein